MTKIYIYLYFIDKNIFNKIFSNLLQEKEDLTDALNAKSGVIDSLNRDLDEIRAAQLTLEAKHQNTVDELNKTQTQLQNQTQVKPREQIFMTALKIVNFFTAI